MLVVESVLRWLAIACAHCCACRLHRRDRGDGPVRGLPVREHPRARRPAAAERLRPGLATGCSRRRDVTFLLAVDPAVAYRRGSRPAATTTRRWPTCRRRRRLPVAARVPRLRGGRRRRRPAEAGDRSDPGRTCADRRLPPVARCRPGTWSRAPRPASRGSGPPVDRDRGAAGRARTRRRRQEVDHRGDLGRA